MTAQMHPLPFPDLLRWALSERAAARSVFGVPESLFYVPSHRRFETRRPFGALVGTPFGPAAGPHTQMAQNIAAAWLCGARYIELKTIQVLDHLEIPRPCIDAADEGYNVEWSQELSLDQSAREYAHAWALVHVLPRALGQSEARHDVTFNQSVGYTLEGIQSPPVRRFLDRLEDARELLAPVRETLRREFQDLSDLEIPNRISDSVTLSTMHGCPPEEIEKIARHLLEDRGLHTVIKLNPTLLGNGRVSEILHDRLGFHALQIPDEVFAHDLRFDAAVDLVTSLRTSAARCGRGFAVKLSNTLAMRNAYGRLPGDAVYMSGRALYPITVELFRALRAAVGPDVPISFSAGADAINAPALVAAGACPVTAATDLLKPGGYGRLGQFLEELEQAMTAAGASTLDDFAARPSEALGRVADRAQSDARYRAEYVAPELPKLDDSLPTFDCIAAPCAAACPACQDVPIYATQLVEGDADAALRAVLRRNPLPGITGHICTARCETRCTRANLDRPVRIRDLKRFAAEHGSVAWLSASPTGRRVAVVGSGPSGLSAAAFLALSGVSATVFEAETTVGGMPSIAPAFRLPSHVVNDDVSRIAGLGVEFLVGRRAPSAQRLLEEGFDAVYLATGFPDDAELPGVPDLDADGVLGALSFLRAVARGRPPEIGRRVLVVGGGNTAIDAARTALRLASDVTVLYRRTRAEMPASADEVDDLLAEGGRLVELVSPIGAVARGRRLVAVDCVRNEPGPPGPDGRRQPLPVPDTRFRIGADCLLVAVGQGPAVDAGALAGITRAPDGRVQVDPADGRTAVPRVFAGGDVVRGPSTIVEAIADGRRAAASICRAIGVLFHELDLPDARDLESELRRARLARCRKSEPRMPDRRPSEARRGFDLVTATLEPGAAREEAARCLACHLACDKCVDVCPNRANAVYAVTPRRVDAPLVDLATGRTVGAETVSFAQTRQVVHVVDLCNECGNCATFCVHDGRPFADKPRLALTATVLSATPGAAFAFAAGGLAGKDAAGAPWRLEARGEGFHYEDPDLVVEMDRSLTPTEVRVLAPAKRLRSTAAAVKHAALWEGLRESPLRGLMRETKGG